MRLISFTFYLKRDNEIHVEMTADVQICYLHPYSNHDFKELIDNIVGN